jgi:Sulfotransferase family
LPYDSATTTDGVARARALFTPAFFAARRGYGCQDPDPIFVVGLPRAGSTLVEQILSSHSAIEGTMELPDLVGIARTLGGRTRRGEASKYPEVLATLDADALRELGERYLRQTRVQRKTAAPRFIDKLPNNWAHVGLIELILPNARIVDARRHPLSCCFSGFKQHFARGQNFSYSLEDIGRYYADYVALMAHYDAVLPGRVHRVFYERMVDDTEHEVRRLLDYCGLPFEEACLRFYENERAVRTASSEQVRQPIFRDAVEHWRNYEPWLGPLKAALGPVLDAYPAAPGDVVRDRT